ncbi:MAG: hypothetical protein QM484_12050 [Woeseiaceae bacterium]
MEKEIKIQGKQVKVSVTAAAEKALASRDKTLVAEMELYFSCLIRKRVRFKENVDGNFVNVTEQLAVRFRPVMTKSCGIDYEGDEPPLEDFPIQKPEAFTPKWLKIDFKKNEWRGEFGF